MQIKPLITLLLLISMASFSSCKRNKIQKSIAEFPKVIEIDSAKIAPEELIPDPMELAIKEVDFDYLKLKTKIDFKSPNLSQSFPANVNIRKDSVIWISVSVGIEAARCLITQDSILMMDRINKKYYSLSIADLNKEFSFDFDFELLQSLIIGNLPLKRSEKDIVKLNSLYTSLFQNTSSIKVENQIDNLTSKLTTILAEDNKGQSKLGISYSDFMTLETGQLVPHSIFTKLDVLTGETVKTTTLDFKHNKIDFSGHEIRFPYSVPKSYEKGEIVF